MTLKIDTEKFAVSLGGFLLIWFFVVMYGYASGIAGAEELAFGFIGASGGASYFLARADLAKVNGGPIPVMWNPMGVVALAAVVVIVGMNADKEEGHHLALAMFSHVGGILERLAKTRAGENEED